MDNQFEYIMKVARSHFPSIRLDNFQNLFKLDLQRVHLLCRQKPNDTESLKLHIRNVLLCLFQLKHYLPFSSVCILFGLEKSQFHSVFFKTCCWLISTFGPLISLQNRFDNFVAEFQNVYTIVDVTELPFYHYGPKTDPNGRKDLGYSGKKKRFTVKYQVIVGATTGQIYHVSGPWYGSIHDAEIYSQSGIGQWLFSINERCLGDRGYQGCLQVLSPHKSHGDVFTMAQSTHNDNVSRYRHTVERVFGSFKKWE